MPGLNKTAKVTVENILLLSTVTHNSNTSTSSTRFILHDLQCNTFGTPSGFVVVYYCNVMSTHSTTMTAYHTKGRSERQGTTETSRQFIAGLAVTGK